MTKFYLVQLGKFENVDTPTVHVVLLTMRGPPESPVQVVSLPVGPRKVQIIFSVIWAGGCQSVSRLSVCQSTVSLSVDCQSVSMSVYCQSVSMSVCQSTVSRLSVCQSTVSLSVDCLSTVSRLSVCQYASLLSAYLSTVLQLSTNCHISLTRDVIELSPNRQATVTHMLQNYHETGKLFNCHPTLYKTIINCHPTVTQPSRNCHILI